MLPDLMSMMSTVVRGCAGWHMLPGPPAAQTNRPDHQEKLVVDALDGHPCPAAAFREEVVI